MASIYKEVHVEMAADELWSKVRDVGAIDRLLPNLLTGSTLKEDNVRVCGLPDGGELREQIIAIDDERRRVAYTITEGPAPLTHHHASMQVFADGSGATLVWITDFRPDDAADAFGQAMDAAGKDLEAALT
ncbi:MAG: SRPBCC family protein [Propionibacteriales bacterium]|nr:SRPBCC family protein [Propionibacteriales bacterium]